MPFAKTTFNEKAAPGVGAGWLNAIQDAVIEAQRAPFVTALPTTGPGGGALVDGQECYYKPDPTNATGNGNVAWHLKYEAASGWWYYIGGPPMYAQQEAMQQINGVGASVWSAPAVFGWNAPLQGDYDADFSGTFYSNSIGGIYVGWKVGTVEPTVTTGAAWDHPTQTWKEQAWGKRVSPGAAGTAINLRMMNTVAGNYYWENLSARLRPVRVK